MSQRWLTECSACRWEGEADSQPVAAQMGVHHLVTKHRLVTFPRPAIDYIRLWPFFALEVVTPAPPASEATPVASPDGGAVPIFTDATGVQEE